MNLFQGLVAIREPEQVPVSIGDQHVFGLAAHPAAHIHITIGAARAVRVDVQADARLALLAVPATAAGDVERYRDNVSHLDELHVRTDLHHFAGDFMAKDEVLRGRGPAPHHVLVRAADIGGHRAQDRAVGYFSAHICGIDARPILEFERRVVGVDDFDDTGFFVGNGSVS
jgi:hypothetical protein